MIPEVNARTILSTARARAKMHEFRVAPEDFNDLPRDPSILFNLAIGILGDVTSTLADSLVGKVEGSLPAPAGWEESGENPLTSLQFSSVFFEAYISADLNAELTPEFSLLCAAAYYVAGNIGSTTVIIGHMEAPEFEIAGGLGFLLYTVLKNKFTQIDDSYSDKAHANAVLNALNSFFRLEGDQANVVEG